MGPQGGGGALGLAFHGRLGLGMGEGAEPGGVRGGGRREAFRWTWGHGGSSREAEAELALVQELALVPVPEPEPEPGAVPVPVPELEWGFGARNKWGQVP